MAAAPPILLFDGHCGFCTASVEWLDRRLRRAVMAVPWQSADLAALGVSEADARREVWWVEPDGRRSGGHRAAGRALLACRGAWPLLGRLLLVPPVSWLAAPGYTLVSRLRGHLPGAVPACRRPDWRMARGDRSRPNP